MKDKTQLPFIIFITLFLITGTSQANEEMDPYAYSNEYDQADHYSADEPVSNEYNDYSDQGHEDTYANDVQGADDYPSETYDRDVASEGQNPQEYQDDNYYEQAPEVQDSLPPEYINNTDY